MRSVADLVHIATMPVGYSYHASFSRVTVHRAGWPTLRVTLVTLLAIPVLAIPVRTAFTTVAGPELVGALKRTATAELAFALLLAVGVLA